MGSAGRRHSEGDAEGVGTELVLRSIGPTRPGGRESGNAFEIVAAALARAIGLASTPGTPTASERAEDRAAREILRALWAVSVLGAAGCLVLALSSGCLAVYAGTRRS